MSKMKLSETELRNIIMSGETTTIELKVAPPRPAELAERLCGMANSLGGLVIIGVEDASLKIVGVQDARMTVDVALRASRQIQPVLLLEPSEPEIYNLDGQQVVVVGVPASRGPIYQSSGVCWVRRSTHTVPLSVSEVLEIANDRGLIHWELQLARKATMEDMDLDKVNAFLSLRSHRSRRKGRFDDIESVLLGMDCARVTNDGEIRPTNAGILFFGYDPQQHIPQSEIVCILYRDELGVRGYIDRKIITGTIQELIDETEAFLNKHIPVGATIEGWKRIDQPAYPIEALREAVVNAVVHRDYSRDGESIRVFYYKDRIEVHSPGLLLPGITVEQMARGEVMSKLRNSIIANLLRDVPGYIERVGSGIKLMLYEMKQMGLPAPQFREMNEFVVSFRKAPTAASNVLEQRSLFFSPEEQLAINATKKTEGLLNQERRMMIAMRYVQEYGSIVNRKYQELTGASEHTALRDLEALVDQGALKRVGKTRGRAYKLP